MTFELPKRVVDSTDDGTLRRILGADRHDAPPEKSRAAPYAARAAAGTLSASALPSVAGAGAAGAATRLGARPGWWKLGTAKWLLVAALVPAAGMLARSMFASHTHPSPAVPPVLTTVNAQAPATTEPAAPAAPAPAMLPALEPLRTTPPPVRRSARAKAAGEVKATQDTLGHEARVLSEAQDAFSRGDSAKALSLIHSFEQQFPNAVLGREKDLLKARVEKKFGIEATPREL